MMQTDTEKLNDAFAYINFTMIHAHMTLVDWKWPDSGGVPSIRQLKTCVRSLMDGVLMSELPSTCHSTGGFSVLKFTYQHGMDFRIVFDIS